MQELFHLFEFLAKNVERFTILYVNFYIFPIITVKVYTNKIHQKLNARIHKNLLFPSNKQPNKPKFFIKSIIIIFII